MINLQELFLIPDLEVLLIRPCILKKSIVVGSPNSIRAPSTDKESLLRDFLYFQ